MARMLERPAWLCLLLAAGCGPGFEVRKEADLLQVAPWEIQQIGPVRNDPEAPSYLADRATWLVYSNLSDPRALIDGDPATASASEPEGRPGDWILLDLGTVCRFQNVRQLHPPGAPPPGRYRVDTAGDAGFPFHLQFVGSGEAGVSMATFPRPVRARFVRITRIDPGSDPWSVSELELQ